MNEMEAIIHKRARGFILKCLNFYPGDDIQVLVITDFVRNCGIPITDSDTIAQLKYLESKEYVEVKELSDERISSNKVTVARIVSKGIDLLEANIPEDPGILIPHSR
ncbi:MAG: hypothetical protein AB1611_03255 [bacterium]